MKIAKDEFERGNKKLWFQVHNLVPLAYALFLFLLLLIGGFIAFRQSYGALQTLSNRINDLTEQSNRHEEEIKLLKVTATPTPSPTATPSRKATPTRVQ